MGMAALAMLLGFKELSKKNRKFKFLRSTGGLIVTVLSIIIVAALGLNASKGIPIVQTIPRGLPPVTTSMLAPIDNFLDMVPVLFTVGVVGFMESVAIAKQLASKNRYPIDSSTELYGLGMAHFLGGMFSSFPVSGSFGRSGVNEEAGAVSGFAGIVAAILGT
jgi:MFS superfamily sulfate permease-like transporter